MADKDGPGKRVPDSELTATQKKHLQQNKDAADKARRSKNMAPWAVKARAKRGFRSGGLAKKRRGY